MSYSNLVTHKELAHSSNYRSANRKNSDIKYIVIHYTAGDGDSDESNARYFKGANRQASAHFFVDDDSITQSVNIKDIAWHCGGSVYNDVKKTGGAKFNGACTNSNSIGIEMCDTNRNGKYELSNKTRNNTIKLVNALMSEFNIDINHVVRHFDVTGKYCPRYFCPPYGDSKEWDKFKKDIVNNKVTSDEKKTTNKKYYKVRKTWKDTKSQIGAYTNLKNAIKACKDGYSVYDWSGNEMYTKASTTKKSN